MPLSPIADSQIDLEAAIQRLRGRVHTTPLLHSRLLDQAVGARLWLKAENFQRSGSFKARGAFNAALVGTEAGDTRGLAALSSGNHGQAVALAASELGLAATVVMAANSSPVKVAAVRDYGADVITQGVTLANREQVAAAVAAERGLRLIHPHDDPHVISGQAMVGYELACQARGRGIDAPIVVVPVGGGGLVSGVTLALRRWLPQARVVGVEPEAGDDAAKSLRAGRLISLDTAPVTVADGAATMRLGELPWRIIREGVDEIVTVADRQLGEACWWLWSRCKLVVEPTGALAVAAAMHGSGTLAGLRHPSGGDQPADIICVLSGGNCLPDQLVGLIGSGRQAQEGPYTAAPGAQP